MSTDALRGRAWLFGDNVDTDQIAPFAAMALPIEQRKLALFPTKPEFGRGVQPGDVIVAGRNWGCGSSREQAPENLRELGIAAVVAESFARIYFRNSIAIGLPALEVPGVSGVVAEGSEIAVDMHAATATTSEGRVLTGRAYTPLMIEILDSGGLLGVLERRVAAGELERRSAQP